MYHDCAMDINLLFCCCSKLFINIQLKPADLFMFRHYNIQQMLQMANTSTIAPTTTSPTASTKSTTSTATASSTTTTTASPTTSTSVTPYTSSTATTIVIAGIIQVQRTISHTK
eukprot:176097_1